MVNFINTASSFSSINSIFIDKSISSQTSIRSSTLPNDFPPGFPKFVSMQSKLLADIPISVTGKSVSVSNATKPVNVNKPPFCDQSSSNDLTNNFNFETLSNDFKFDVGNFYSMSRS